MAFGTGEHATTRLCCRWLRRQLAQGSSSGGARVVDYGAGSGVLGLAALVFGAKEAAGVEIDPDSITAAHANAALNGMPGFRCYLPAEQAGGAQDSAAAADAALARLIRHPQGAQYDWRCCHAERADGEDDEAVAMVMGRGRGRGLWLCARLANKLLSWLAFSVAKPTPCLHARIPSCVDARAPFACARTPIFRDHVCGGPTPPQRFRAVRNDRCEYPCWPARQPRAGNSPAMPPAGSPRHVGYPRSAGVYLCVCVCVCVCVSDTRVCPCASSCVRACVVLFACLCVRVCVFTRARRVPPVPVVAPNTAQHLHDAASLLQHPPHLSSPNCPRPSTPSRSHLTQTEMMTEAPSLSDPRPLCSWLCTGANDQRCILAIFRQHQSRGAIAPGGR